MFSPSSRRHPYTFWHRFYNKLSSETCIEKFMFGYLGTVRTHGGAMLGFERITFDSHVMGGRACIRGMRITVSLVVNLVANGMTITAIIDAYPYLEPEDMHQALHYVAWLAEETVHPLEPVHP